MQGTNTPAPLRAATEPAAYMYTTAAGATYILNTTAAVWQEAADVCAASGGRLAGFSSLAQQADVEQHFLATRALLPGYHGFVWLGLTRPLLEGVTRWG